MNETASSGVRFTVGQIVTLLLCAIVVGVFAIIQQPAKATADDITSLNTQLNEQKFFIYDNGSHNGSHVYNTIKQYQSADTFGVYVITGKNPNGTWYNREISLSPGSIGDDLGPGSGNLDNTRNERSIEYINLSGPFKSELVRDANNVIRGIVFRQVLK